MIISKTPYRISLFGGGTDSQIIIIVMEVVLLVDQ